MTTQTPEKRQELIDELRETQVQMLESLEQAKTLIKQSGLEMTLQRAESYWLAHAKMALTNDHGYLGGSRTPNRRVLHWKRQSPPTIRPWAGSGNQFGVQTCKPCKPRFAVGHYRKAALSPPAWEGCQEGPVEFCRPTDPTKKLTTRRWSGKPSIAEGQGACASGRR